MCVLISPLSTRKRFATRNYKSMFVRQKIQFVKNEERIAMPIQIIRHKWCVYLSSDCRNIAIRNILLRASLSSWQFQFIGTFSMYVFYRCTRTFCVLFALRTSEGPNWFYHFAWINTLTRRWRNWREERNTQNVCVCVVPSVCFVLMKLL